MFEQLTNWMMKGPFGTDFSGTYQMAYDCSNGKVTIGYNSVWTELWGRGKPTVHLNPWSEWYPGANTMPDLDKIAAVACSTALD